MHYLFDLISIYFIVEQQWYIYFSQQIYSVKQKYFHIQYIASRTLQY